MTEDDASVFVVDEELLRDPPRNPSLAEQLELGRVLRFEPGLLPLPPESDLAFLRTELGAALTLKNISFHPEGDYLSGISSNPELRTRTKSILREHNQEVERFLTRVLPEYAGGWAAGKVNFRPIQEKGRQMSRHSSNERVHVDAFASGATHGARILRFFTNIHPTESRLWRSAGLFPELFQEFGERAGIGGLGARGLHEGLLDRALSNTVKTLVRLGLPQARTVDSSPYDRAMRRMHNYLKDDDTFQADWDRCTRLEFPPFTSWLVLTDQVSHACISGQHALVNTWYVDLACCQRPDLAPYHVLAQSGA